MTENKRYIDDGFEAIEDQSFTDTKTDKTYYVDYFDEIIDLVNRQDKTIKELEKENDKLKNALKNSYLNEICENCKHGYYYLYDNQGLEGDFECKKGHDSADCDGLKDCDDFELEY